MLTSSFSRSAEFGVAPALAKRVLNESSYTQIIHTGSNAGELIGAVIVLVLGKRCVPPRVISLELRNRLIWTVMQRLYLFSLPTPIPYIRLDALSLLIIWAVPTLARRSIPHQASWAWTFVRPPPSVLLLLAAA